MIYLQGGDAMENYVSPRRLQQACDQMKEYVDNKGITGVFTLQVDADGNLYAIYPDGSMPPVFDYNTVTGDLYLVVPD